MKSDIRKYKTDHNDFMYLAEIYMDVSQCAGGRIVKSGLVCAHCDSDNPSSTCLSPNPAYKKMMEEEGS